jgi:hypothetical protein
MSSIVIVIECFLVYTFQILKDWLLNIHSLTATYVLEKFKYIFWPYQG